MCWLLGCSHWSFDHGLFSTWQEDCSCIMSLPLSCFKTDILKLVDKLCPVSIFVTYDRFINSLWFQKYLSLIEGKVRKQTKMLMSGIGL